MEIITMRHFCLSILVVLIAFLISRSTFIFVVDDIKGIYNAIGYLAFFLLINLPAVALQYIENKHVWSKLLTLKDNLSFFGVSIGSAIGLFSLARW
jgi:hypothetical protein